MMFFCFCIAQTAYGMRGHILFDIDPQEQTLHVLELQELFQII